MGMTWMSSRQVTPASGSPATRVDANGRFIHVFKGAKSVSRVLITGGAGFIGSHVTDLLLEEGHEVRVYDRLVEQVHGRHGPRHVPTDAEFVRGDMRDAASLRAAL